MDQEKLEAFKNKIRGECKESEIVYLLEGDYNFKLDLDSREKSYSEFDNKKKTHFKYDVIDKGELKKLVLTNFAYSEFKKVLEPLIDSLTSNFVDVKIKVSKENDLVKYDFEIMSLKSE